MTTCIQSYEHKNFRLIDTKGLASSHQDRAADLNMFLIDLQKDQFFFRQFGIGAFVVPIMTQQGNRISDEQVSLLFDILMILDVFNP